MDFTELNFMEPYEDYLAHYGVKRRSGRYPYGSGDNPYQHENWFLNEIKRLRKNGMTDNEIAKSMGMNSSEFRKKITIERANLRSLNVSTACELLAKGYNRSEVAKMMGVNESTVRSWLDPAADQRSKVVESTAEMLKKDLADNGGYLQVGAGTEAWVGENGVSPTKFKAALQKLEDEGYLLQEIYVDQMGTNHKTTVLTLAPPGTDPKDIFKNLNDVRMMESMYSNDQGETWNKINTKNPTSIDSSRIEICYPSDGGAAKDGIIELRRGVKDLDLGGSLYAQCRIAVDDKMYLKGIAMYADDLPPGKDIRFNTSKKDGTPFEDVLKPFKTDDPNNVFGATIKRQMTYIDENGNEKLSPINICNEQGDWGEWSRTLASQMLSKQSTQLAKTQLGLSYGLMNDEFKDIMSISNDTVRKKLLEDFSESCDGAAVHLKAAALPGQAVHVLLPCTTLKENEIYAPNYENGTIVSLIRYPHAGTFEIPTLVVNNNNKEGQNAIGKNAPDAVGINSSTAAKLSGADFDGDTALVIPNPGGKLIKSRPSLEGLQDFEPKAYKHDVEEITLPDGSKEYRYPYKVMTKENKGRQMGEITNLITDMSLQNAKDEELVRAVKHSMVVIDAEKHKLDYEKSYEDNNIEELKQKYQKKSDYEISGRYGGASTLLSRATSSEYIPDRRKKGIDPETGEQLWEESGKTTTTYTTNPDGTKTYTNKPKMVKITKMESVKDANDLLSYGKTSMERIYADHANKCKALGNDARKAILACKPIEQSAAAKKTFAKEIESLDRKLNEAIKAAPLERQAMIRANVMLRAYKADNPGVDKSDLKKKKGQFLVAARQELGSTKKKIWFTPREWEAVQSGAISSNKLSKMLQNADMDEVKKMAMPRTTTGASDSQKARIKSMAARGYTQADIARVIGVSTTTVSNVIGTTANSRGNTKKKKTDD